MDNRSVVVPNVSFATLDDLPDENLRKLAEAAPRMLSDTLDSLDKLELKMSNAAKEAVANIEAGELMMRDEVKREREKARKYYAEDVPKSLEERKRRYVEQLKSLSERFAVISASASEPKPIPELKISAALAIPTPPTPETVSAIQQPSAPILSTAATVPPPVPSQQTVQQPPAPSTIVVQPSLASTTVLMDKPPTPTLEVPYHTVCVEAEGIRNRMGLLTHALSEQNVSYHWVDAISLDLAILRLRDPSDARRLVALGRLSSPRSGLAASVYKYDEDLPTSRREVQMF